MTANNEPEIDNIVEGWVKYTSLDSKSPFRAHYEWADDAVLDLILADAKKGFEIVKALLDQADNEWLIANIAAGPLETLLSNHGETIIDAVERESLSNEKFRHLLGGVWRCGMSDEVWQRFQKIDKPTW